MDGTAAKPFVFRTLVPSTIGAVASSIDAATAARLQAAFAPAMSRLFRIDYSLEALIALPLVLGACNLGPDYKQPVSATPEAWQWAPVKENPQPVTSEWWKAFNNEESREKFLSVRVQ